jgi:hypothetical protein
MTTVVTTPNYEANPILYKASNASLSDEDLCEPVAFREEDHKFEFSRSEFRQWVSGISSSLEESHPGLIYSVRFFEVLPFSFTIKQITFVLYYYNLQVGDLSHYPGGALTGHATQGVVFDLISDTSLKDSVPWIQDSVCNSTEQLLPVFERVWMLNS